MSVPRYLNSLILALTAGLLLAACGAKPETLPNAPASSAPSSDEINKAISLVARTLPAADALGGLTPLVGDDGLRIGAGRPTGASSLLCDVGNQAPLPAEKEAVATASTAYQRIHTPTATASWQLNLSVTAMRGGGSDQALTELRNAAPRCPDNPLSIMHDVQLGNLDGTQGVVFRSTVDGSPQNFNATCVVERNAEIFLRSCGSSTDPADSDGLAIRGLTQLRTNLEAARKDPNAAFAPDIAVPNWLADAVPVNIRKTPTNTCSLLSTKDIEQVSGRKVSSFDPKQCTWKLDAGSISLNKGTFSHQGLTVRGIINENPSYQDDRREDTCEAGVIFSPHASLDSRVTLTVAGKRPCDVSRQLLTTALDRLPTL